MSTHEEDFLPEDIFDNEPIEWRCGQCDAYWFNDPGPVCKCCGGDSVYPVYEDPDFPSTPNYDL